MSSNTGLEPATLALGEPRATIAPIALIGKFINIAPSKPLPTRTTSAESKAAMDEPDEEETGESVDVAALMGFGSFGDQHRGKRRKYTSRTDGAVVDGSQPGLDTGKGKGRANGSGSGSNNLPIGTGRSRPRPKKGGSANAGENEGGGHAERFLHAASSQDNHAPLSPSSNELPPPPTATATATAMQPPRPTSAADTSLPPKPLLPSLPHSSGEVQASTTTGRGTGTENEAWKLRKGVRLANGDTAYYDASFVEDPWRGLR